MKNQKPYRKKESSLEKSIKDVKTNKGKNTGTIRLNKFIAMSGVCSRRDADILISNGKIAINGKIIREMGYQVNRKDAVTYLGKKLETQKFVYVLLNKPKDFITTTDDPQKRKTVMDLVKKAGNERLFPVGRLDRNTMGLLLLTNDGELAKKLTHPSHNVPKIYHLLLDKPLTVAHLNEIIKGIELDDGMAYVDEIEILDKQKKEIGLEIHMGKNRIVRRIFEKFDYTVLRLDRVMYANLTKKDLPRGKWRFLKDKERVFLKHF